MPPSALVIGYGNTLRRDDGIGPLVAREIATWQEPDVHALDVQELTPELADSLARHALTVFVDAHPPDSGAAVRTLAISPTTNPLLGHALTPGTLLGLTRLLHGTCPLTFAVTARADDFGLGEELSQSARGRLPLTLDTVSRLLRGGVVRLRIDVSGIVQGVGFRPFVYALASARGLTGSIRNDPAGARLELQGSARALADLLQVLQTGPPPGARIDALALEALPTVANDTLRIAGSELGPTLRPSLPADLALCGECAREIADPGARRYRYPFTNCTHCGPRYTLVRALPYDRPRTAMHEFELCASCHAEYTNPADRRFHAQVMACPECGPELALLDATGERLAHGDAALARAAAALERGQIVALKGLGGFQLLVNARDEAAVQRLRARKHREHKPFAVLFRSPEQCLEHCAASAAELALLTSPRAPIVLCPKRAESTLAPAVAPDNPYVGALLPYTPLHRLLSDSLDVPLVCTSGNLSEEPMCIDEPSALDTLGSIADLFLTHNRPIVRPMDDSLARLGPAGPELLRRARGYTPEAVAVPEAHAVLAVGAHLKSTVAVACDGHVVVSQHLGDLASATGAALHERTARDLCEFLGVEPALIAGDWHPDYVSTRLAERLARELEVPFVRVQHHHAHVAACMAEHGLRGPLLGLAWDGSGLGTDGVLWGSEALIVDGSGFRRIAHLRPFRLPGGERAIRDPARSASGILHALGSAEPACSRYDARTHALLGDMLDRGVNSPWTTSMGRLFDALACLTGVRDEPGFEGQAAMALEFAARESDAAEPYPLAERCVAGDEPAQADWQPLIEAALRDRRAGTPAAVIAARFHASLVHWAGRIARAAGLEQVVLSGGCFQNALLTRNVHHHLSQLGFRVFVPQRFPSNDGGISLGQILVASTQSGTLGSTACV